jgi:hypothetical protein
MANDGVCRRLGDIHGSHGEEEKGRVDAMRRKNRGLVLVEMRYEKIQERLN